jgi:hypothetical protein
LIERPLPGLSFAAVGFLFTDVLKFFYTHCPGEIIQIIRVEVKKIPELSVQDPYIVFAFIYFRGG